MEKDQSHIDGLNAAACRSQGGASRDQGASSAKNPKDSGDSVTHSNMYTKQDGSRGQGGPPANPFHDV